MYWKPSLLLDFRQLRLLVGSLVTTTNLRSVKSPQNEGLNITEVSTPTSDLPQSVLFTGSQLSLNASPMFVASYLLSSPRRTLILIRPPLPFPPQLRPLQMKTDLHCPTKPHTTNISRCISPHGATSSLAYFSHHNRTNEFATSDRFTSAAPSVFSLFQHYILICYQFKVW